MAGEENLVDIQEFARLDIRVGTIKEAAGIEGAKKLVVLQIDLGSEVRQVVAGIRGSYEPESLPGKKVCVVTNLKKAVLRGVESNGMIIAAVSADGRVSIVQPEGDIENGARVS